jgi:hypothetical protein
MPRSGSTVRPVQLEDYNAVALQALQRAQDARGVRSAEAFAKLLAARTGGAPSSSTYHRWLRGETPIPAWVLLAAAEEAAESLDTLVSSTALQTEVQHRLAELDDQVTNLRETIGEAVAEIASVREHTARLVVPELEKQGRLIATILARLQEASIVGVVQEGDDVREREPSVRRRAHGALDP